MALVAYIIALIIFVLAGFGVDFDWANPLELVAFGLAFFVLGHILPNSDPRTWTTR
jgi:hypothetical protein